MRTCRLLFCLMALVLCFGCGNRAVSERLQGEITFDGKKVEKGRIDFVPIEGTPGGAVGASIVDGRYEFPPQTGLSPTGIYSVRILALQKTGRTEPNRLDPKGTPLEIEENFLPPIYNSNTTLKVKVPELSDKTKVDFHLDKTSAVTPH